MPKPHRSGLMHTGESEIVKDYLVASHSYPVSDHDLGTIDDVEAISCLNEQEAIAIATKRANKFPGEKIYIFKAIKEVVKNDITIKDL